MDRDTSFLFAIAAAALCLGLADAVLFLLKRNRTARTTGTITYIGTALPRRTSFRNSKWAAVSYQVDGKTYLSENRIQVPMASRIGSSVTVRYDTQRPEVLYHFSVSRIVISLFISALCTVAAVSHLI